ncbi:MAG TPA: hypothetical protein VHP32_11150 [Ignavibacteria bacterium]|nr:hypothetical protein [Ignavibacteria bacterium]
MGENPEPEQDITPEPQKESKQPLNTDAVSMSLSLINEKLDSAMQDISRLKERQDLTGHEVDILQTQSHKAKKWYSDTPVLVSTFALLLSAVATLYPIFKEKGLQEEAYKTRAKEIVQRLTEIQTTLASSGINYNSIFASTQAEASNLLDEAISISDVDPSYLNDAGYVVLINHAFTLNKTERIKDLLSRAVNIVDDTPTHYAIKNSEANYYFNIKKDSIMGRNSIRDAIRMTEEQQISDDLRRANIAQEYILWCNYEFNNSNFKFAEQLLEKAEELIVKRTDDWRYKNYAAYNSAIQWRAYIDTMKAKSPNFFR